MAVTIGSTSARAANKPDTFGNVYIQNLLQEAGGAAWDSYADGSEDFTINEGVTLIVDPASAGWRDMTKGPKQITINNGKLLIRNTSTTTGLRFLKARNVAAAANTYIVPYGLGVVDIQGNWIELGVSDGTPNQVFTSWSTDYVPAVQVETAPGSGVYEWWYNTIISEEVWPGGQTAGSVARTFFPGDVPFFRQVSVLPGAFTVNMRHRDFWTNTLVFGDGVNCKIPPNGCKVRVPNIILTDQTIANLRTAGSAEINNDCRIDLSNGGSLFIDTATLSFSWINGTQSSKVDIRRAAMQPMPVFQESYAVRMEDSVCAQGPLILAGNNANIPTLMDQSVGYVSWDYVSNMVLRGVHFPRLATNWLGGTVAAGNLKIQYSNNIDIDGVYTPLCWMYGEDYSPGIRLVSCNDVLIKNWETRGGGIRATSCTNVAIDGLAFAQDLRSYFRPCASDPYGSKYRLPDGNVMALGIPYWIKIRSHHDWWIWHPQHEYVDTQVALGVTRPLITYSTVVPVVDKSTKMNNISVHPNGTTKQIQFAWTTNSSAFFYKYECQYSTDPNFTWYHPTYSPAGTGVPITITNATTQGTSSYLWTAPADNTVYYFKFRLYEDAGLTKWTEYGTFAAQAFVISPTQQVKNYLLRSLEMENTTNWVTVGTAATRAGTGQENGPFSWSATAASQVADQLSYPIGTAESGIQQTSGTLTSGVSYTFYIWLRTTRATPAVTGKLYLDGTSVPITIEFYWKRFSVTAVSAGTTMVAKLTIDAACMATVATAVRLSGALLTETSNVGLHVQTTTAVSALVNAAQYWERGNAGRSGARIAGTGITGIDPEVGGIDLDWETAPGGTFWTTAHLGTSPNFTPDVNNMFGCSGWAPTLSGLVAKIENSIVSLKNVTKIGYGTIDSPSFNVQGGPGRLDVSQVTFDLDGGVSTGRWHMLSSQSPSKMTLKDCDFGNVMTLPAATFAMGGGNNYAIGLELQNVRCNQANFAWMLYHNGAIFKGVSGARKSGMNILNSTVTSGIHTLAGTSDGFCLGSSYQTAVYDSHFFELYHDLFSTPKVGSLNILMTPSSKADKPYVLEGTAAFDVRGALYFQNVGDRCTWTWPHKILGVSGFHAISYILDGSNIVYDGYTVPCPSWGAWTAQGGNAPDIPLLVDCEYNISTDGSSWSGWKRASAANLGAEVVSATTGFYLKVRLTALAGICLTTQTASNLVGVTLTGATTGASGRVLYYMRTSVPSGYIIFEPGTYAPGAGGHFLAGETITNGAGITLRYSMYPRTKSMYVSGLRIMTKPDPTAKYPINTVPVRVAGIVPGSRLIIKRVSDNTVLTNAQVDSTSYELFTEWVDTEVRIELRNASGSPAYKPWYSIGTITSIGLTVTALQERDDV